MGFSICMYAIRNGINVIQSCLVTFWAKIHLSEVYFEKTTPTNRLFILSAIEGPHVKCTTRGTFKSQVHTM